MKNPYTKIVIDALKLSGNQLFRYRPDEWKNIKWIGNEYAFQIHECLRSNDQPSVQDTTAIKLCKQLILWGIEEADNEAIQAYLSHFSFPAYSFPDNEYSKPVMCDSFINEPTFNTFEALYQNDIGSLMLYDWDAQQIERIVRTMLGDIYKNTAAALLLEAVLAVVNWDEISNWIKE